jgi:hypothetical protein
MRVPTQLRCPSLAPQKLSLAGDGNLGVDRGSAEAGRARMIPPRAGDLGEEVGATRSISMPGEGRLWRSGGADFWRSNKNILILSPLCKQAALGPIKGRGGWRGERRGYPKHSQRRRDLDRATPSPPVKDEEISSTPPAAFGG